MASTVTRSSQRSPVIQINGYSFLLPVVGAATTFPMSDPTASIGHRPSLRTIRTSRTACYSNQAASTGTKTAGFTADLSVLSQNKIRAALPSAVAKRQNRRDARRQPGIPDKNAITFPYTLRSSAAPHFRQTSPRLSPNSRRTEPSYHLSAASGSRQQMKFDTVNNRCNTPKPPARNSLIHLVCF